MVSPGICYIVGGPDYLRGHGGRGQRATATGALKSRPYVLFEGRLLSSSSHYLKAPIYLSPLFFWKKKIKKKGVITAPLPGGGERAGQPRRTDGATAAALPGGGERPGGAEDEAPRLLRPRRRATAPGRQWRPSGGGRSLAVEAGATPLPRMVLTATNGGGMSRRRRVAGVGAS